MSCHPLRSGYFRGVGIFTFYMKTGDGFRYDLSNLKKMYENGCPTRDEVFHKEYTVWLESHTYLK